jgi:glutamyl/glutaminyl-tRNA synthetase
MKYVTRIAPSPTGLFHLGTARTAYFNYLVARASGGKFILRIDDSDQNRNKPEYTSLIYDTMKWLGLSWDHTFKQSERQDVYKATAYGLLAQGKAFTLQNGALALKWPADMPNEWRDEIAGRIAITETNKQQCDGTLNKDGKPCHLILLREDGSATYQFASVVDDVSFGISYIIRGVDHISNTAKQIAIWRAICDKPLPLFAHIGLVFKDKKKLSKRDGAASMLTYRDKGYNPEAILDCILRLGWMYNAGRGPEQKEIEKEFRLCPKDKAIASFLTRGTMKASPANFDATKLEWFNREYGKF